MTKHIKFSEVAAYIGAAFFVSLAIYFGVFAQSSASPFISSELGIATLSPNGQLGGAMMPASGCTGTESGCGGTPDTGGNTCDLTLSPTTVDGGDVITATVATTYIAPTFSFERCWNDMTNCVSMGTSNPASITTNLDENFQGGTHVVQATVSGSYNHSCNCVATESGTNCSTCTSVGTNSCISAFQVNDAPECSDGVDNGDADTLADADDPGCHTDGDATDGDATYDPTDPSEADPVSVSVEACDIGGANCEGTSKTIGGSDEVEIQWTTWNAWTCTRLAGPNNFFDSFATSSSGFVLSGTDSTVNEPSSGNSLSFTLECDNGAGQTVLDSVVVVKDLAQCEDGIDNDADGFTDFPSDPSCTSSTDDNESPIECSDPAASNYRAAGSCSYACSDGVDNDSDGLTDHPNDPGCTSPTDTDEFNVATGTPTISVNPTIIRSDQSFSLSWDPGGATGCSLTSNVDDGSGVPDANTAGSVTLTAERTREYAISCSGGLEDSVQITVLPTLLET